MRDFLSFFVELWTRIIELSEKLLKMEQNLQQTLLTAEPINELNAIQIKNEESTKKQHISQWHASYMS